MTPQEVYEAITVSVRAPPPDLPTPGRPHPLSASETTPSNSEGPRPAKKKLSVREMVRILFPSSLPLIFLLLFQGQSSNGGSGHDSAAGGVASKKPHLEGGAGAKSDFTPFQYHGSSYTQFTQGTVDVM